MIVYLARDILPFVKYCVNRKPCSSLLIESTDSMIIIIIIIKRKKKGKRKNIKVSFRGVGDLCPLGEHLSPLDF